MTKTSAEGRWSALPVGSVSGAVTPPSRPTGSSPRRLGRTILVATVVLCLASLGLIIAATPPSGGTTQVCGPRQCPAGRTHAAAHATGGGAYWLVASDGGVFGFGGATFHGSTGALSLNRPIVGMADTVSGGGYWLVASDGGIFAFGDAVFHGSTGAMSLNRPIVGMAATADGGGYWLVASDGGIFSLRRRRLPRLDRRDVTQPAHRGDGGHRHGGGYWLVASDGGIFAFGDAVFYGSTGGMTLNRPIVGMAATPTGAGTGWWPPTAGSSPSATPSSTARPAR